jgi:hypothetical protein
MKTLTLLLFLMFSWSLVFSQQQQQKVVHFKKLQTFLPSKEIDGFKKNNPTGSTTSSMGFSTSEAAIRFVKATDSSEQSIEIKIMDMSLVPYGSWALVVQQTDIDNQTETGYEKTVTVKKKYKGIEKADSSDGSSSCSLNFAVDNRFHVEMDGNGFSDTKILYSLAETMDLKKLSKLIAE